MPSQSPRPVALFAIVLPQTVVLAPRPAFAPVTGSLFSVEESCARHRFLSIKPHSPARVAGVVGRCENILLHRPVRRRALRCPSRATVPGIPRQAYCRRRPPRPRSASEVQPHGALSSRRAREHRINGRSARTTHGILSYAATLFVDWFVVAPTISGADPLSSNPAPNHSWIRMILLGLFMAAVDLAGVAAVLSGISAAWAHLASPP